MGALGPLLRPLLQPVLRPLSEATSGAAPEPTAPGKPINVTAVAGDESATVSFTAPSSGGSPIIGYTVTSDPGGIEATGTASPIVVTGLDNGTPYTFTVVAENAIGEGPDSEPSNEVTPWSVTELFANGEAGAWYDISDVSTMFQDLAMTTPAVVGGPVAVVLDKSGNVNNWTCPAAGDARPTLLQDDDGNNYLYRDGVDDYLVTSAAFTIKHGWTLAYSGSNEFEDIATYAGHLTLYANATNYFFCGAREDANQTGGAQVRVAASSIATTTANGGTGSSPHNTVYVRVAELKDSSITWQRNDILPVAETSISGTITPAGSYRLAMGTFNTSVTPGIRAAGAMYGAVAINRLLDPDEKELLKAALGGAAGIFPFRDGVVDSIWVGGVS